MPRRKGSHISEAHKRAIARAQRGRPKSLEHRAKLSAALKGRKISLRVRRRMGAAHVGLRHSESSKALMAQSKRGALNPQWKGGRIVDTKGYVWIKQPSHPNATAQGYVREHILVMGGHLGRPLVKGEIIHHINGDKADNRIENLKLMSHGAHSAHHRNEELAQGKQPFGRGPRNH